ncbi:MAG: PAS domain S-box protein, partial [Methanomicrobiales archaeon]|nr:PAS domain S-box protein [Methanomicrobiales archaeon]
MSDYTFDQLVDITQVRQLLESHHRLSGMAYGLFDADENNLIAVGWQDICVRFHRVNPVTSVRCRESDAFIKANLYDFTGEFLEYRCKNGMIDIAMPIIIDGRHLATFFTGQFFYDDDPPDREYFIVQAGRLGFDREEYLNALERVPVFSREHIRGNVLFLHNMVQILAEKGLNNLKLVNEMEERNRVEEALRAERGLFVSGPTVVFKWKAQDGWPVEYVSPNVKEQFGYAPEELTGGSITFAAIVHPDDLAHVAAEVSAFCEQGVASFEQEYRIAHADGSYRWIQDFTTIIRGRDGAITHYLGYVLDITERKRVDELLRKREQEFRAVVENSPDTIARYDRDCRRVYINPATERVFGRPAREVMGMKPTELSPLPEAAIFEHYVRGVLESGQGFQAEIPFRSVKGEIRWGHIRIVPEFGPDGEVVSVLSIGRDINVVKEAEKGLRASEQRFRDIFDNSLDCLYLLEVTEDGRFRNLEVNPAFERSTGVTRSELIGKYVDETVPGGAAGAVIAKYRRCVETGAAIEENVELDLPGGRRFYHSTLIPVRDESGRIHRIVGISRDVTERRRAEQLLELMNFALDHVAEAAFLIDEQAHFHYVNEEACRALGYRRDELLTRSVADVDPDWPAKRWPD